VPHGQWVPLDMDIDGIWRYWGNYSFFGAPFICNLFTYNTPFPAFFQYRCFRPSEHLCSAHPGTTIHNMGGNDGMKGDMRMLRDLPGAALSANASIVGTGATPEGIDQNPIYYEYRLRHIGMATGSRLA
jgi:hypothetical protein